MNIDTGSLNLAWADALVSALVSAGLQHVVLAPGARSAPLALAVLRRPELTCHVVSDERAAGFFALGIGKASGRPAAVVCTSGTAAANLLPAIMEANLAGVPLLALTADRPAEAHGWGANQCVDQTRLYATQVRASHALPEPSTEVPLRYLSTLAARLLADCLAPQAGPVHVNIPFREPLLPTVLPDPPALPQPIDWLPAAPALPGDLGALAQQLSSGNGVIVCGEARYPSGFATALAQLAAQLQAPILAEALANLRFGTHDKQHMLAHQSRFLRMAELPKPDWVLRLGRFPVSRPLEQWLASLHDTQHVLVAAHGWPDPLWRSSTVINSDPAALVTALLPLLPLLPQPGKPATTHLAAWQSAELQAAAQASAVCTELPVFEGSVARLLCDSAPAGCQLFVGNSLAIRALDSFSGIADKVLRFYGNRGASGIDGNLATAAGLSAAGGGPLAVLLGDQSALYDCSSLALLAGRDAVVVLLDNAGGGIFDHLPFAAHLPKEVLSRGWTAPSQVDFGALATGFGLKHCRVNDAAGLSDALSNAFSAGGAWLVQVHINRDNSLAGFKHAASESP